MARRGSRRRSAPRPPSPASHPRGSRGRAPGSSPGSRDRRTAGTPARPSAPRPRGRASVSTGLPARACRRRSGAPSELSPREMNRCSASLPEAAGRWQTGTPGYGLPVEGLTPLATVPQADQVALEMGLSGVLERGTAVGDRQVVEVLDLASLDGELDAELGRFGDGAHCDQGLSPLGVQRRAGQRLGIHDQRLVVAGPEGAAPRAEHRPPSDLVVTRRVLGLPVPGERTIEPWEEVGMPALQLVMHGGEADDLAHPALTRWLQTVEPNPLGRQGEPRAGGM